MAIPLLLFDGVRLGVQQKEKSNLLQPSQYPSHEIQLSSCQTHETQMRSGNDSRLKYMDFAQKAARSLFQMQFDEKNSPPKLHQNENREPQKSKRGA